MEGAPKRKQALSLAYTLLTARRRSEAEVRMHLQRAGLDEATIDDAVATLMRQGLVDDRAFAAAWTDGRQTTRPRSRWLLQRELQNKGIADDIAAGATQDVDDEAAATDLARKRAPLLRGLDRASATRRLSAYLLRRGFSGETVRKAVRAAFDDAGDS